VPSPFEKQFAGGLCRLTKAGTNCKIYLHFERVEEQSANSIEELFTNIH
jgi:hypothetical protein